MRTSSLVIPVLFALSASVSADPLKPSSFTFCQWVEDIIADPNGIHLSPSEAVAAVDEARAGTTTLLRRANCETSGDWGRANVRTCSPR